MNEDGPTSVSAAFETILRQIEAEIERANRTGSRAFEAAQYDRAREILARVEHFTTYRGKVFSLRDEWQTLAPPAETPHPSHYVASDQRVTLAPKRRNLGRAPIGQKTAETGYYVPILKALVEFGGSAPTADVLDRVEALMKHTLKPADYAPRKSHPGGGPGWRNSAEFARNKMVHEEGLLKHGSPRGIWEITEEGRQYLRRHQP
jgi:hypothetical protein